MSADASRPLACVLVENGLHMGARLELREAGIWYSAGGVTDTEYWLADADLAEGRVAFAVVDGMVRVRLEAGPAMVLGTASFEVGGEATLNQPLLWGGVSFRAVVLPASPPEVRAPGKEASAQRAGPLLAFTAALRKFGARRAIGVVVALAAVAVPGVSAMSLLSSMLERQRAQVSKREALLAQEDPQARLLQARAAAQRLADLVAVQAVSVTALDGKTLAVSGTNVPSEHREPVRAAIEQFQHEFTVHNHVIYRSDVPPRPTRLTHLPEGVNLVQYGPQGYLRGQDGRLYLAGGVLPDGTQVDAIRDREVWLSRGNERAVLIAGQVEP